MDICFLYGPPATGKLTVAQKLQDTYPHVALYHNHLAVDLVSGLFDRDKQGDDFFTLIAEVHLMMIKKSLERNHQGIIMTSCYIHPEEEWFITALQELVAQYDARIIFIQLTAAKDILLERVGNTERATWGKLRDPEILDSFMTAKNLTHYIDAPYSYTMDTGNHTPIEIVQKLQIVVPDLFTA